MGWMHKTADAEKVDVPIQAILHNEGFEKRAQEAGGARKQIMLLTWGAHTLERQFGQDVVERVQKIKDGRDIMFHQIESSFMHSWHVKEKYEMETGKDFSIRRLKSEVNKEFFNNLKVFNEMFKAAGNENAGVIVDIHYGGVTHYAVPIYGNSKIKELNSNPIVFVSINSKEVFEKYMDIPGIVADLDEKSMVPSMRIRDRMRVLTERPDYASNKAIMRGMRDFNMVQVEGMVFHNSHGTYEEMKKCSIGKEEYEQVVVAAAETVIRIYDYFNSKILKGEQQSA